MLREIHHTLHRMTDQLDLQCHRLGKLQSLLDDHDDRLDELAARIESTRSRIEALLAERRFDQPLAGT